MKILKNDVSLVRGANHEMAVCPFPPFFIMYAGSILYEKTRGIYINRWYAKINFYSKMFEKIEKSPYFLRFYEFATHF